MPTLFVYGTLRSGQSNHRFLDGAVLLADRATTNGTLVDSGNGYPGMLLEEGIVYGELYEVSEDILFEIDQLESYLGPGHPDNLYERVEVEVIAGGKTYRAWTYVYLKEDYFPKRFSDWVKYTSRKLR